LFIDIYIYIQQRWFQLWFTNLWLCYCNIRPLSTSSGLLLYLINVRCFILPREFWGMEIWLKTRFTFAWYNYYETEIGWLCKAT